MISSKLELHSETLPQEEGRRVSGACERPGRHLWLVSLPVTSEPAASEGAVTLI